MLLFVGVLGLFVACFIFWVYSNELAQKLKIYHDSRLSTFFAVFSWIFGILFIGTLICFICTSSTEYNTCNNLEQFFQREYPDRVQELRQSMSRHTLDYSAVKDFEERLEWYNRTLTYHQKYHDHFYLGIFNHKPPEGLTVLNFPIIIPDEK